MARPKLNFIMGVVAGIALFLLLTILTSPLRSNQMFPYIGNFTPAFRHWPFSDLQDFHMHERLDRIHGDVIVGQKAVIKFQDLHVHHDNDSMAKEMAKRVRVLVWVMTSPGNLNKNAVHVKNTWGRRANTLLFMSSQWNRTFPAIGLKVLEGRRHLTGKTMQAFRYVYDHYFDDADWFMKADDDTYVIMENLRHLLSAFSNQDPIYFGHAFRVFVKQGFASGGAGYVLSKEALRRLATEGINHPKVCQQDGGAEDLDIGKCLMKLRVRLVPSLDRLGRTRFHCFTPETHIEGSYKNWYRWYDANGAKSGMQNISDYPVSFHYITPSHMYAMEYFVYHLRPYGTVSKPQSLNLSNSTNQTGR